MASATEIRPDHNSLGKAAGIIGVIGLILSFVPLIGFVSWFLTPLAIIFGLIALRRVPRSWAIVGIITGVIGLFVCVSWIHAAKSAGQAMSADTFNTSGETRDNSQAPIIETTIKGLWRELEDNKIAAGKKYGGKRLAFSDEKISDFSGDVENPSAQIVGKTDQFMSYSVAVSFAKDDGAKLGVMKKGDKVSFVCTDIGESFGEGYSLKGCKLR